MSGNFFAPYPGNKYREAPVILSDAFADVDWSKVKYVIEPFCGSAGFSRYIHNNVPTFNGEFLLRDVNVGLVKLLNIVSRGGFPALFARMQTDCATIVDKNSFIDYRAGLDETDGAEWYLLRRVRGPMQETIYSDAHIQALRKTNIDRLAACSSFFSSGRVYAVVQDCRTTELEVARLVERHGPQSVVVFADPPYFNSCNSFYTSSESIADTPTIDHKKQISDTTGTFVSILRILKTGALCASILSHSALLADYYDGFVKKIYDKTYGANIYDAKTKSVYKKHTLHMLICK